MTRFSKPALLAGGLAAALLLSTGIASAAPAYGHDARNTHAQTFTRDTRDHGKANVHKSDAGKQRFASRQNGERNTRERNTNRFDHRFERGRDGRTIVHAAYDRRTYRDAYHRPPMRIEYRAHASHSNMHWRAGEWRWQNGQWVWMVGTWLMAAQALSH